MFDVILGSVEQKSTFRSICVHFKTIFHANLKKMSYQGGRPRLEKSFPCAQNFFFSLTDDIFFICNLKVTKTAEMPIITCSLTKKLPKKYFVHISGYIPPCPSPSPATWSHKKKVSQEQCSTAPPETLSNCKYDALTEVCGNRKLFYCRLRNGVWHKFVMSIVAVPKHSGCFHLLPLEFSAQKLYHIFTFCNVKFL